MGVIIFSEIYVELYQYTGRFIRRGENPKSEGRNLRISLPTGFLTFNMKHRSRSTYNFLA
jgi:hypothetical protein